MANLGLEACFEGKLAVYCLDPMLVYIKTSTNMRWALVSKPSN